MASNGSDAIALGSKSLFKFLCISYPAWYIYIQGGPEKNGVAYFPQYVDA